MNKTHYCLSRETALCSGYSGKGECKYMDKCVIYQQALKKREESVKRDLGTLVRHNIALLRDEDTGEWRGQ